MRNFQDEMIGHLRRKTGIKEPEITRKCIFACLYIAFPGLNSGHHTCKARVVATVLYPQSRVEHFKF